MTSCCRRALSIRVEVPIGAPFASGVFGMANMSSGSTLRGVGRLHRGHRNLGCVGYPLEKLNSVSVVTFDPMPDAANGDVFHLTLEDGRVLECQVPSEYARYCAVIDGPRAERRHHRRPAPTARAFL